MNANIAAYWNTPEVWAEEGLNLLDRDRIPKTMGMIPSDVRTILEVGCGNGRLSNCLTPKYKVFGLDISRTALGTAKFSPAVASADTLPVASKSVDLVLCCDVLEHLPEPVLSRTVAELKRVARKYVLVGLPYRETIEAAHLRCLDCSYVGHQFGHLWSWDEWKMDKLICLPILGTSFAGQRRFYFNRTLLAMQQRLGKGYWESSEPAVCHGCGGTRFGSGTRSLAQKVIAKAAFTANAAINHVVPRQPHEEIIRLYAATAT